MESEHQDKDEMVIYLIVRKDLKMTKGKIAAQCGHAVQELIVQCPRDVLDKYRENMSYPKICLQVPDYVHIEDLIKQFQEKKFPYHLVKDEGRTQTQPGSHTVLGLGPIYKSQVKDLLNHLKLL